MGKQAESVKGHERVGLSGEEAAQRLLTNGPNELEQKHKVRAIDILARQFANFIVYVLISAAVISLLVGEMVNFWVIGAIIAFVIALGFLQEYRAEKAMAALLKIVTPLARAYRNGKLVEIPSRYVVPGDVILLETGDKVPADAQVFEIIGMRVDESALTGESVPVEKVEGETVYAGTQVVHGRCKGLVLATGMKTKLGTIASLVQAGDESTNLQKKMGHLSKMLAGIALGACALTFALGVAKGAPLAEILIISLALAVAAVPEGLALTLTITLAYGMKHMAEHNAIIRKMLAVETLGSVTVIATDKTGTLTKNEMTVEKIYVNGSIVDVAGNGYAPKGEFTANGRKISVEKDATLSTLLRASTLCNNSSLSEGKDGWGIIGDPTEAALAVAAAKAELWRDDLEMEYRRVEEIVFTSERKLMTTIHESRNGKIAFTKGAPEILLGKCTHFENDGKKQKLSDADIKGILRANKEFSSSAYRTIAVAYKESGKLNEETGLVFVGIMAMRDPPREEVLKSIGMCRMAGIKVVMITGDHEETARAIAKNIALLDGREHERFPAGWSEKLKRIVEDSTITGSELETLTDEEFREVVEYVTVYARIMPEQKLKIVDGLKANGHIVAMTGDGVNDAPALKKADIGIAMGLQGTDVARESSSMILMDNNFATIVEAVKQGRTIYSNIEKFTCYLISRNFTEVILILLGITFLGFELLPLLALQILFINTFDEIMPALSLGLDPSRDDVMSRKPRRPGEPILKRRNLVLIAGIAAFLAITSFLVFVLDDPVENLERARTLTFATIISSILFVPFAFRSLDRPALSINPLSNKLMLFGSTTTFAITIVAMYTPFFQKIFGLTGLALADWPIPILAGLGAFAFIELLKHATRGMKEPIHYNPA